MFSLIYARIKGWVNNGEAGDLRRYRAHSDVIVMCCFQIVVSGYRDFAYNTLSFNINWVFPLSVFVSVGGHWSPINTLRPRQNGRHFADDIFKCIFLNEGIWIPIRIPKKFIPKCLIKNNPALVQIIACRRPGDKPLSEPMTVSLPTHICVIRPKWVNK